MKPNKIKEKVLKEVMDEAWYSQDGYKRLRDDPNIESSILPTKSALKNFETITFESIKQAINLTLAEVGKVIDELEIRKKKIPQANMGERNKWFVDYNDIEKLKQKLGIGVLK